MFAFGSRYSNGGGEFYQQDNWVSSPSYALSGARVSYCSRLVDCTPSKSETRKSDRFRGLKRKGWERGPVFDFYGFNSMSMASRPPIWMSGQPQAG